MLSPFFVMLANSTPGTEAPLDVNVPMVVFGQKLGVTLHAGIDRL